MKKLHYLFVILFLIACGKKQAVSYKDYQQAHLQTRERHIQLIKTDAEILDTLFNQDLAVLTGRKKIKSTIRQEVIMDHWTHSAEYLKSSRERHEIYSHQVVYNKKTSDPVITMWVASSELSSLEGTESFNILMEVKYSENHELAITLITKLKKSVAEVFAKMLKGAEEYQKIVFEQK